MSALFRRHSTLQCFFCQSSVPFPANIRNFRCSSCGCWNRYDDKGEIISDEPAMHEEHLNSRSFAKRASPSKDRLPTMYGPGPFCHSCQTNQMLLINLLSNYLPDPSSPEYQSRLEMLPAYRESLHARYPPVCESCLPQVEEEMRRKEQMARVQALGGWLTKGKERQRRVSSDVKREKLASDTLFWWKVRGCLWGASTLLSVSSSLSVLLGYNIFKPFSFLHPVLPLLVLISVFWAIWDPTFASFRKAQQQGRDVRLQGKRTYNFLQFTAWLARLISSSLLSCLPHYNGLQSILKSRFYILALLVIDVVTLIGSAYVLRLQQPPAIRLIDTTSHRFDKSRSGTPVPRGSTPRASTPGPGPSNYAPTFPEHDILSSLSLSSKPVINHSRPVFGLPSLHGSQPRPPPHEDHNEDEMDWMPTNPESSTVVGKRPASSADTGSWLRPQKFFAPEKPTGLEGLLESARIQDEPMPYIPQDTPGRYRVLRRSNYLWYWAPLSAFAIAVGVASVKYTSEWSRFF